jgi:hypothetical protein
MTPRPDLKRTINEIAEDLEGIDYRDAEGKMRRVWRRPWLRILEAAQAIVRRPTSAPAQLSNLFRTVGTEMASAAAGARSWMNQFVPRAWRAGQKQAEMQFGRQDVHRLFNSGYGPLQQEIVAGLARKSMADILRASRETEERTRQLIRRVIQEELDTHSGARAIGKRVAERLAEDNIFGIRRSDGRFMHMWEYARLVAHMQLRTAHTEAVEKLMGDNGMDLVLISTHVHPVDMCTPLEGKVYSISGRDPRFPPLVRHTPFHPGCYHYESPFVDRFHSDEELEQFSELSQSAAPIHIYDLSQLGRQERSKRIRAEARAAARVQEQLHEEQVAAGKSTAAGALKKE